MITATEDLAFVAGVIQGVGPYRLIDTRFGIVDPQGTANSKTYRLYKTYVTDSTSPRVTISVSCTYEEFSTKSPVIVRELWYGQVYANIYCYACSRPDVRVIVDINSFNDIMDFNRLLDALEPHDHGTP